MILYFFFHSYQIFVIFSAQPKGVAKEMSEKKRRGRQPSATCELHSPTGRLPEQNSGARRDKRAARGAIRRELSEQMTARRADVESEASQLTRER